MHILLNSLAEVMSVKKDSLQKKSESILKKRIFELAKNQSVDAAVVYGTTDLKESTKLKPILSKVDYLSKNLPAKFLHHLQEIYSRNRFTTVNIQAIGAATLYAGGTFIFCAPTHLPDIEAGGLVARDEP